MKRRPTKTKAGSKPARPPAPKQSAEAAAPLPPRRKWQFRFIALVVLPVLLLGGLELILRLAGYGYDTGFLERIRVGEKEFLVNNENFSLRFFPAQLARSPGPVMMEEPKPANTYRIIVLGESAARGEPEPPYAASRYLQVLLNERFPQMRFEVFNLGITAINSHVILPIARDCRQANANLWIIYMGNNEMVGPFGAATIFGTKSPPLAVVRLSLAIQSTRVGQLLADLGRRWTGTKPRSAWTGMDMFAGNQLRADDPRREVVYQNFQRNLDDIIRAGLNSGASVLLNTVAVNLKDCPPFASLINSNLPAGGQAAFQSRLAAASADEARGNFAVADGEFEQIESLDPLFPELHYRWGQCLLAQSNLAGARNQFQIACDVDALPFRADSRINQSIRGAGGRFAGDRFRLLDAAAVLATNSTTGLCGDETFYEHVHFNFDGNFRLGLAWAEEVMKLLPPEILQTERAHGWAGQETCDQWLGLTDWNRHAVTLAMLDRLNRRPFSEQAGNARRMDALRAQEKLLRQQLNPANAQKAAAVYQAAIQRSPQDHLLRENYAEFLEAIGDLKRAAGQWEEEQALVPHNWEPFFQAGRLLGETGHFEEAEVALKHALTLRPGLADGWCQLGDVKLKTRDFAAALLNYNRACGLEPQNAAYCASAANALSKLGRPAEAIQKYRQAIQMQPDLWIAHYALANELASGGDAVEAEKELQQVLKLQPKLAPAHLARGVMLARLGQVTGAAEEFQTTLELDPTNQTARAYLDRIDHQNGRTR